jgi:hypothetical protein
MVLLQGFHIVCCRAFLALRNIKADALTFMQRLETLGLNGAVMNKHITTVILFDETEAFLLIKPLYFTFWHRLNPPFSKFSQSRIAALTERKRPPRPKGHGGQPLHFNMSDPTSNVPYHY